MVSSMGKLHESVVGLERSKYDFKADLEVFNRVQTDTQKVREN